MSEQNIQQQVREKYAQAALNISTGKSACCGSVCGEGGTDAITANLYESAETADLPADAVAASLGCGNPTALAQLQAGETVLDLGSGGGIDVLLSPSGLVPPEKRMDSI
jgi:arsenite methyltransferase